MKTKVISVRVEVRDLAIILATLEQTYGLRIRSKSELISLAIKILARSFERSGELPFPIPNEGTAVAILSESGLEIPLPDVSVRREVISSVKPPSEEELKERAASLLEEFKKRNGESK